MTDPTPAPARAENAPGSPAGRPVVIYAVQHSMTHIGTTLWSVWLSESEAAAEAARLAARLTKDLCWFGSYEVWAFPVGGPNGGEHLSSHYGPYPSAGDAR